MRNCYQSNNCAMPYTMHPGSNPTTAASDCSCYLAIANIPWQYFSNAYEPERAFQTGTLFPELDKPFLGRKVNS